MPEVNIGLITKSLDTDALISALKAVEDPESMVQYADETLTNSFSNTEIIWELSRGMSSLCYRGAT